MTRVNQYWKNKFEIAGGATENFFSRRWIAQNIFDLSEEEFVRNQREMFHDRKFESELNAAAEAAGEQAAGEFGSSSALADDSGDYEGGDFESETDISDSDLESDMEAETDEGPLLDTPAKRRDSRNRAQTPKSQSPSAKGKSYVSTRLRGGDGRNGRIQNYTARQSPNPKSPFQAFRIWRAFREGFMSPT